MNQIRKNKQIGFRVVAPARTSVSVIDMNLFAPGKAGAGNFGFAIDYYTEIEVYYSNIDQYVFAQHFGNQRINELEIYVRYIISTWRKYHPKHSKNNFKIILNRVCRPHIGVASFASIHFCLVTGISTLLGLTKDDFITRKYLHENYKEVVGNDVVKGFTTGLSSLLNQYGGFALISEHLEPRHLVKLPDWHTYLLIPKNAITVSYGMNEVETLMGLGRDYDRKDICQKMKLVDLLIKSVKEHDLKSIGEHIYHIQKIGSKVAEIGIYGTLLKQKIEDLYNFGFECCFLSALGPGIVVITDKVSEFCEIENKFELEIVHKGVIDNIGLNIETIQH